MKLNLIAVSALVLVGMAAQAQDSEIKARVMSPKSSSMTLVPVAGAGISTMQWEGKDAGPWSDHKYPSVGLSAGLLGEFGSRTVSFQTGLLYLRESMTLKFESSGSDYAYKSKADLTVEHLGIPLIAKMNNRLANDNKFTFRGGLVPAYNTGMSAKGESSETYKGKTTTRTDSGWNKDGLRAVNVFGLVGVGLEIPTQNDSDMRFELTYDRSLLPINHDTDKLKVFSESLLFSVGMGIVL